jgi:uncharacterized repeat protein (TIGR01451 family)
MKKLILLFLVLVLKFVPAKAQWVFIGDPNFVDYLTTYYPSCMNGNLMDTTCSGIVNQTSISINYGPYHNLNGLQYFDNLTNLYLTYNDQLTSLPNLRRLNNLLTFNCSHNNLSSLSGLPNSLTTLICSYNGFTSLPVLPANLTTLDCRNNNLYSLPALPNNLTTLQCNVNLLQSLPALPNSLSVLNCFNNLLLSSLPALPNSLTVLNCHSSPIMNLPALPNSLSVLTCNQCQLTSLPALPNSLTVLTCYQNQLTSLPALPNSLTNLNCSSNQLNSFPAAPSSMENFQIQNNNISCLVNLPNVSNPAYVNISNNPISCIPNQTNYSLGLPLCLENDQGNNPNNCPGVNITGNVYNDLNGNCAYNSNDLNSQNIPVKLYDNLNNLLEQSFTINGVYNFTNLLPNSYQVKIDVANLPFEMSCGQTSTQLATLTAPNQTIQNVNFPLSCDSIYDIYVNSVIAQGWVFPGQSHTLLTNVTNNYNWFNLNCDSTIVSGTVSIQVNGPVSFVAPAAGALTPTVNGNNYSYFISDFNTLNPNSFGLSFMTDTTAQFTDRICVQVEISPNPSDADTTNNVYDFCYNVVNSYDPNMKEVYPVNVLPGYDDWFTYTIHFQNTGNAPAFNIRLRDTLDTQLDLNTFEVLGYSHPANVGVSGNILTVRFNNIMLPDSTSDYEGSMGYFQYRLKPLPNLPNGSQIRNTAYIYFDYNAPIVTNTTENNFDITVPVKSLVYTENSFSLYPNPSTGVFIFKDTKNVNSVEVYSIVGEKILSQTNQKTINLNGFSKGIYFARVNGGVVLKMVKE